MLRRKPKRVTAPLALMLALWACCSGRGTTSFDGGTHDAQTTVDLPQGDCTQPGRSCVAPFVCRTEPPSAAMVCLSPPGDVPSCDDTPSGQVVPFQPNPNGPVAHWALAPGCLATSHTAEVSGLRPSIVKAVKVWDDIACSRLCLEAPVENEVVPDLARGERRVHFKLGTVSSGAPAVTTVDIEPDTGRIFTVVVTLDRAKMSQLSEAEWVRLVGFGIGLAAAVPGIDSVMSLTSEAKVPTANDVTALCKLYGNPSYCGD